MNWVKRGRLFESQGQFDWMRSHAAVPFAEPLGDDVYRCYFSSRDSAQRARIGRFDFDMVDGRVLALHPAPVVDLGPLGAYDDHGVVGSWLVEHDRVKYLYFSGMTLGVTVPFYFYVGLAVSEDGGETFHKVSDAPILERDAVDPYLTGQVCVRVENGLWRMWYVSGERWVGEASRPPRHYYNIKYAESHDGVSWRRQGVVCIDFQGDEHAIARPCVVGESGRYQMWFCRRGRSYRLACAESADGIRWERIEGDVGIDVSEEGWDSEMLAYPFVVDHRGRRFMLYNGNDYGRTGIGLAELVPQSLAERELG